MDPFSIAGLGIGAAGLGIGGLDAVVKLGRGLRNLQQTFSGALEHVDSIAQQTRTIELAIEGIRSTLENCHDAFPQSFELHLTEYTGAIERIVAQLQGHVELVQLESAKSLKRGKAVHTLNAKRVAEWRNDLNSQAVALNVLLSVARLPSYRERTIVFEQASSKKIFERASSMSGKASSSNCPHNIQSFSFDSEILQTKVYRRACEFSLKWQITTTGEDPNADESASLSSVSSNDAIASQSVHENTTGADESSNTTSYNNGPEDTVHDNTPSTTTTSATADVPPPLMSQSSTSGSTQLTAVSSETYCLTRSTVATTISSQPSIESESRDNKSIIKVVVQDVGSNHVDLPTSTPDLYKTIEGAIVHLRNLVLVTGGVDPASYHGIMTDCTIEASGQRNHEFPFSATFIDAAMEMLGQGLYSSLQILAHFSAPPASPADDEIGEIVAPDGTTLDAGVHDALQESTALVPHIVIDDESNLPFTEKVLSAHGGFSKVFKVKIHPEHLQSTWGQGTIDLAGVFKAGEQPYFALKSLKKSTQRSEFQREVEVLKDMRQANHTHIVQLVSTFQIGPSYHLMFEWADGNLRDYWKTHESSQRVDSCLWMAEQCRGIAQALSLVHNTQTTPSTERHWRHGDLKPENILWFSNREHLDSGILKIADFGVSERVDPCSPEPVNETRLLCTGTYRAPEFDLELSRRRVLGREYDIWSLGCVFLEFITWYLEGYEAVRDLAQTRSEYAGEDSFFVFDGSNDSLTLNRAVTAKLEKLRNWRFPESPEADIPVQAQGLDGFLDLIEACLAIDARRRPSASILAQRLCNLYPNVGIISWRKSHQSAPDPSIRTPQDHAHSTSTQLTYTLPTAKQIALLASSQFNGKGFRRSFITGNLSHAGMASPPSIWIGGLALRLARHRRPGTRKRS